MYYLVLERCIIVFVVLIELYEVCIVIIVTSKAKRMENMVNVKTHERENS